MDLLSERDLHIVVGSFAAGALAMLVWLRYIQWRIKKPIKSLIVGRYEVWAKTRRTEVRLIATNDPHVAKNVLLHGVAPFGSEVILLDNGKLRGKR